MTYTQDGFNYVLRFNRGELVVDGLLKFISQHNLHGGWVLGLGGLAWAELGFYDLSAQEYSWEKFDELLELTNLTGNIAWQDEQPVLHAWQDEQPVLHAHVTVSDASFHAHGGHLKEAEAAGTVEVFIHMLDQDNQLERKKDSETGLNLLSL